MKVVLATLLLVSMILSSYLLQVTEAIPPPQGTSPASAPSMAPNKIFCRKNCARRCSKAGRKKMCLKDCGICCKECNCVPSGFYGNKSECPCYRDKLNSKGKPKCP